VPEAQRLKKAICSGNSTIPKYCVAPDVNKFIDIHCIKIISALIIEIETPGILVVFTLFFSI